MASRKPYECFRCRDIGFPNTMVFLAGKDEQEKTIYIEEDGVTSHTHRTKLSSAGVSGQQQQLQSQKPIWDIVNAKLDRIISLLDESR